MRYNHGLASVTNEHSSAFGYRVISKAQAFSGMGSSSKVVVVVSHMYSCNSQEYHVN